MGETDFLKVTPFYIYTTVSLAFWVCKLRDIHPWPVEMMHERTRALVSVPICCMLVQPSCPRHMPDG